MPVKEMSAVELHKCHDGRVWAEQFMYQLGIQDPKSDEKFDMIQGWFCNAIMSGHDLGIRKGMKFAEECNANRDSKT